MSSCSWITCWYSCNTSGSCLICSVVDCESGLANSFRKEWGVTLLKETSPHIANLFSVLMAVQIATIASYLSDVFNWSSPPITRVTYQFAATELRGDVIKLWRITFITYPKFILVGCN